MSFREARATGASEYKPIHDPALVPALDQAVADHLERLRTGKTKSDIFPCELEIPLPVFLDNYQIGVEEHMSVKYQCTIATVGDTGTGVRVCFRENLAAEIETAMVVLRPCVLKRPRRIRTTAWYGTHDFNPLYEAVRDFARANGMDTTGYVKRDGEYFITMAQ